MENDKKSRMKKKLEFWSKANSKLLRFMLLVVCWRVWISVSPDTAPTRLLYSCDQWLVLGAACLAAAAISKICYQQELAEIEAKEG